MSELTDKTENALKIAGDVYAARVFTLVAARLGLEHWKGSVRAKLKTLDDIYRFAVEQTAMARGEMLELAIVLILVLELACSSRVSGNNAVTRRLHRPAMVEP